MCVNCAAVLRFGPSMTLERTTREQLLELDLDELTAILQVQRAVAKVHLEKKKAPGG